MSRGWKHIQSLNHFGQFGPKLNPATFTNMSGLIVNASQETYIPNLTKNAPESAVKFHAVHMYVDFIK
jgi:hypothetical protein